MAARQSRFQVSQRRVPFNIPKVEAVEMDDESTKSGLSKAAAVRSNVASSNAQVGDHSRASDTVRGGEETGICVLAPAETDGDTKRHVRGWAGRRGATLEGCAASRLP